MNKILLINKNDLEISQSISALYNEYEVNGIVVNPLSGAMQSDGLELPFIIKSTNKSIPIISEEFCVVSRALVNVSEQHCYEAEASVSGNKSMQNPQKPLRENSYFTELRGKHGG